VSDLARGELPEHFGISFFFGSPVWSPLTEGYWRGAGKGHLTIPRCDECRNHRWPPSWACFSCHSQAWHWDEVPGTGTVFTYTWADQRPTFDIPLYNITVVELDGTQGEPVRLWTQVVDVTKEELRCDLAVEVCFSSFDDEVAVPMFRVQSS
jgi:uncharacterized OB-fold protein